MAENHVGQKIAELRNQKGLTQEELAVKCNINVRSIQRIEKGEVQPRKYTLKILSEALGYDLLNTTIPKTDSLPWLLLLNLSNIIPILVVAILVWAVKREEYEVIDRNGKTIINYQITFIIFYISFMMILALTPLLTLLPHFRIGNLGAVEFVLMFPFMLIFANIILVILNVIRSIKNNNSMFYPAFKFIR